MTPERLKEIRLRIDALGKEAIELKEQIAPLTIRAMQVAEEINALLHELRESVSN